MLSDATFGRLASTNVLSDWVELPSQLMEHWFDQKEVLKKYARHFETGEPVPDELLEKLEAARSFQQGFQTVEYTICALLDMSVHQIEDYTNFDLREFERTELERLGMPQGIVMRHRPAHFQHLFSTSMYAAGYYVYQVRNAGLSNVALATLELILLCFLYSVGRSSGCRCFCSFRGGR